jgi:hypothetical protein
MVPVQRASQRKSRVCCVARRNRVSTTGTEPRDSSHPGAALQRNLDLILGQVPTEQAGFSASSATTPPTPQPPPGVPAAVWALLHGRYHLSREAFERLSPQRQQALLQQAQRVLAAWAQQAVTSPPATSPSTNPAAPSRLTLLERMVNDPNLIDRLDVYFPERPGALAAWVRSIRSSPAAYGFIQQDGQLRIANPALAQRLLAWEASRQREIDRAGGPQAYGGAVRERMQLAARERAENEARWAEGQRIQEEADRQGRGQQERANQAIALLDAMPAPTSAGTALGQALRAVDLAGRLLADGHGQAAALLLLHEIQTLRTLASRLPAADAALLRSLANNLQARAHAYRTRTPVAGTDAAQALLVSARDLQHEADAQRRAGAAEHANDLDRLAADTRYQAALIGRAAQNTNVLIGLEMSRFLRDFLRRTYAQRLSEAERQRLDRALDMLERLMREGGLSFDQAYDLIAGSFAHPRGMVFNHQLVQLNPHWANLFRDQLDFLRTTSRGLVEALVELSEAIRWGNATQVTAATQRLREVVRRNANRDLTDIIARETLAILLTTVLTAGLGGLAEAGAATVGLGASGVRAVRISSEVGASVPIWRVMSGRGLDASLGEWGTDYAFALGGYGLFRALGAGWRLAFRGSSLAARSSTGLAARTGGTMSGGYRGRGLTQAAVEAITADFRRAGGVVDQSVDAQRYLQMRGAGGLTLNQETILLPANPTKTAVYTVDGLRQATSSSTIRQANSRCRSSGCFRA